VRSIASFYLPILTDFSLRTANVLPPPHDLELPIVKLMNHPTYLAFQSQTAALSLLPNLYVKYIPPSWNAPTPPTPSMEPEEAESKQKQEWKQRIKMYRELLFLLSLSR
jgi:hypothetical protein